MVRTKEEVLLQQAVFGRGVSLRPILRHKHEWQKVETSIAMLNEVCRCGATREILN